MTKTTPPLSVANLKDKLVSIVQNNIDNESISKKVAAISAGLKSTPTILSRDVEFEGQIKSSGVVEIEGYIKGVVKGNVVALRESGFVEGTVFADSFTIRGRFEGDIKSRSISIASKARVVGKVEYETLFVEDGAYIDGQFKCMNDSEEDK